MSQSYTLDQVVYVYKLSSPCTYEPLYLLSSVHTFAYTNYRLKFELLIPLQTQSGSKFGDRASLQSELYLKQASAMKSPVCNGAKICSEKNESYATYATARLASKNNYKYCKCKLVNASLSVRMNKTQANQYKYKKNRAFHCHQHLQHNLQHNLRVATFYRRSTVFYRFHS